MISFKNIKYRMQFAVNLFKNMEHLDANAVLQLHFVETRQLVGSILLEIRRLNKFMFGELSGSIFGRFKIC